MIRIKGTQTENGEAASGSPYEGKEPARPSRTPYIIGAILAAVATYFQTALQGSAAAPLEKAGPPRGQGAAGKDSPADDTVQAPAAEANEEAKPAARASERGLALTWDNGIQFGPVGAGALPRPANLDLPPLQLAPETGSLDSAATLASRVQPVTPVLAVLPQSPARVIDPYVRQNAAPRISDTPYDLTVRSGAFTMIAAADLLAAFKDPDGDTLTLTDHRVSSGSLIPLGDGFLYLSDPNHVGEVSLRITASDGEESVTQLATITIIPDQTIGTAGVDTITGGGYADDLRGEGGNDVVNANAGLDVAYGGAGDDSVSGGAGNDLLYGDDGNDLLLGGDGNDTLWGGAGDDRITGEAGNDLLMGEAGNDVLTDGNGNDTVLAGDGNDTMILTVDLQGDRLDGGLGNDTLNCSATHLGVVIDVVGGKATGREIGLDQITGFERIVGGSGSDRIIAGFDGLVMTGGVGDDTYQFIDEVATVRVIRTVHQIMDFTVGDRIQAKGLSLFEVTVEENGGLLGDETTGLGDIPRIDVTYETFEGIDQTVLKWHGDDETVDAFVSVVVVGHHNFGWSAASQT
jgi:hypothetical protein